MRISEIVAEGAIQVDWDEIRRRDEIRAEFQRFADDLKKEFDLRRLILYLSPTNDLELNWIATKEHSTGVGSEVMRRICAYADEHGWRIILKVADRSSGAEFGTTSRARLIKFYHRFGFVMNTGKNHDKTIRYFQMYRKPMALSRVA
jgi:GNAT superfamily N-acetyltransferase